MKEFFRWLFHNRACVICGYHFSWAQWKTRQIGDNDRIAHDAKLRCNEWID